MKLDHIKPRSTEVSQAEGEQLSLSEELLQSVVGGVSPPAALRCCCGYKASLQAITD